MEKDTSAASVKNSQLVQCLAENGLKGGVNTAGNQKCLCFTILVLNLSQITHFWCKFLGPKKATCVNVLTFSTSGVDLAPGLPFSLKF